MLLRRKTRSWKRQWPVKYGAGGITFWGCMRILLSRDSASLWSEFSWRNLQQLYYYKLFTPFNFLHKNGGPARIHPGGFRPQNTLWIANYPSVPLRRLAITSSRTGPRLVQTFESTGCRSGVSWKLILRTGILRPWRSWNDLQSKNGKKYIKRGELIKTLVE